MKPIKKCLLSLVPIAFALCSCSQGGGKSKSVSSDAESSFVSSSASQQSNDDGRASSSVTVSSDGAKEDSKSSSSKTSESKNSSSPSDGIAKPSATSVSFSFWTTFGQKNGAAVEKAATDFAKIVKEKEGVDVNISVNYQGGYTDIENKITQGLSTGDTPTMAIAYPDHVANYLSKANGKYVYNIEDYMNDPVIGFGKQSYLGDASGSSVYDADDFVDTFLDEGSHYVKDGYYSLPLMKSSEVMFYNKKAVANAMKIYMPDMLSDNDVDEFIKTMSWDQLLELAEVARDNKDKVLSTMETPIWYDSDGNFIISKMYQNDIPYSSVGEDGKGKIDFETGDARTKTENLIKEIKKNADDGLLTTKGVNGTYGSDAFKSGKVIFEIGSSGGTGYNSPEGGSIDVGIVKVPASNDNPLYVTQGPTMTFLRSSAVSEQENDARMYYAWQFAKYLTNPDTNVYLCIYGSEGYLPVRYSAYETDNFIDFMEEGEIYAKSASVLINDIDGHYLNTDVFVGSAQLRDKIGGALTSVLKGIKTDVSDAVSDAISDAKTYF
jgi:multiple sugar transport system substrate-binding protein